MPLPSALRVRGGHLPERRPAAGDGRLAPARLPRRSRWERAHEPARAALSRGRLRAAAVANPVRAVAGASLELAAGRDRRARRRERLRQVDAGAGRRRARGAQRRPGAVRRRAARAADPPCTPDARGQAPDGLPGPLLVAQPAPADRVAARRRDAHQQPCAAGAARAACDRAARAGRPAGERGRLLPAPVQRRPAPAPGDRSRAGGRAVSALVLDEPLSALDASAQAQVANLLVQLCRELGIAMLLISHDLAIVRQVADRISVMYLGRDRRDRPDAEIWTDPQHPYTQALIGAIPRADGLGMKPETAAGRGAGSRPARRRLPLPSALPVRLRSLRGGDTAVDRHRRRAQLRPVGCTTRATADSQTHGRRQPAEQS